MSHRIDSAVLASTILESPSLASANITSETPAAVRGGLVNARRPSPRKVEIYILESEFPYCALPSNYFERARGQSDASKGGMVMEISRV